jgi:hypothetical protein
MTTLKLSIVIALASLSMACGKKDPAADRGDPGSCDNNKDISMCTDFTAETGGRGKKFCTGAWAAAPCPKAALVGGCSRENGNLIERYYSSGGMPQNAAGAKKSCEGTDGKFLP